MDFFRKLTGLNQGKANINVNTAPSSKAADNQPEEQWLADDYEEGQLAIDVYQSKDAIIVKSTIAGVKPDDIDISINNDLLTIRGTRKMDEQISTEDYFYQECFWGKFSRSVILPQEIDPDEATSILKNGVLTIRLPKLHRDKSRKVKVRES